MAARKSRCMSPLARARPWASVPLFAVLAVTSAWFGLYLMSVNWAP